MHATEKLGASSEVDALVGLTTRCGSEAQSDQETVQMLAKLELLTEKLRGGQLGTSSSSSSIQSILTELDNALEQPGKGGHTLAHVVISNAIWLRLEGQDSGSCPAKVLVWLGVRVLSTLAALCRPSCVCGLDSSPSGRGHTITVKQDYRALADIGLGAALTAALHASVAASELGVSSPGGRKKDDPLLLEVRGLCLESLLTLVSLEAPWGHKWRTRLGGEGACAALCASLAAEHAQPHNCNGTSDGWAQASDEEEKGQCPGCWSCGGASPNGTMGKGESGAHLQWARRRSLACRTLAALAYRHPDNQHAIREAGGVALVVRELESAGTTYVHRWAVRLVSWLSHNNYRCQDALGTAGTLGLLLTQLTIALTAPPTPAEQEGEGEGEEGGVVALDVRARAVAEVLQAIANSSFKHYANQDALRREGGLLLLLKALAAHLSTKEVAMHACRCVSVLCWSNKANQQGLGRLGAATFLMEAVNTHISTTTASQHLQGNATKAALEVPLLVLTCEALAALCWDCPENVAAACRANIARVVCDWMRAQLEVPLVQARGTQLLADLLAWAPQAVLPDLQERLRQCGFSALLSSNFHLAVASSSTQALSATLSLSATLGSSLSLSSSGLQLSTDGPAMMGPGGSPMGERDAMLRHCARGIAGLTRGEKSLNNRDVLGDAGACEFVCRVLASGGTDWALRAACLEALACLAAHHSRNQDTLLAHGAARLLLLPSLCPPLPPPPSEDRSDGPLPLPLPLSLCTSGVSPAALLHAQRLVAVAALAGEHTRAQDALGEACAVLCHVCMALPSCPHVQLQALKAAAALACDHQHNQELLLESGVAGVLHRVLSQCGSDSPLLTSALSLMVALLHQPSTVTTPTLERSISISISSSIIPSLPPPPPSSPRPYHSSSPPPHSLSTSLNGGLGLHRPLCAVQLLCQPPSACVPAMCRALASAPHPRDVWLYACAAVSLLGRSERRLTCPLLLGPDCHAIETLLLPALRLFPTDAWIQAEALDALANLAPAATGASTAALLHTLPMVVAALRDSAPPTPRGHTNAASASGGKTGGSMQSHPRLLVRACLSLALIANHAPACQSALHEAGAASALCRLLSRCNSQQDGLGNGSCGPSASTSLLSHVVKAITNLSRKHAGNQDALVAGGACAELCQSMSGILNASRASASGSVPWVLLVQLLGAFQSLSNGSLVAQDALGETDACALVCEALFRAAAPKSSSSVSQGEGQDDSRLQVQLQGLSCVMALARAHAANQARMGEAGAGARVCEALSSWKGVGAVQVQAFQAMYAVAWGCARNQEYLGLAGAHGLVCDVLREALSENDKGVMVGAAMQVEVVFYANKALSTLAYKCPSNQHRLRRAGACMLLLTQLQRWSSEAQGSVCASPCVDSRRALQASQSSLGGRGLLAAVLEAATALTKQCPENVEALAKQGGAATLLKHVIAQCEAMGEARGGDLQRRATALYKACWGDGPISYSPSDPRGVLAA